MPVPNYYVEHSAPCHYDMIFTDQSTGHTGSGHTELGSSVTDFDYYAVTSIRTPGWHTIPVSQRPRNGYAKETQRYHGFPGSFSQTAISGDRHYSYVYHATAKVLGLNVSRLGWTGYETDDPTQKAVSSLIENVQLGRASTGVALAELGKTASHLAHTATRLFKAITALKKGRFGDFTAALGITVSKIKTENFYTGLRVNGGRKNRSFRYDKKIPMSKEQQETRIIDFLSRSWLEYSYAWKPLLSDVYDHGTAFRQILRDRPEWRRAYGRAKSVKNSQFTVFSNQVRYEHTISSQMLVQVEVGYSIPADDILGPLETFGLSNPLAIAWEVVPFSFVADWFLPIGSALENLTAYNGLEFRGGSKSIRHVFRHQGFVAPGNIFIDSDGVSYECTGSDVRADFENVGIARSILITFPPFGWPRFKDPRSLTHMTSSIALLQSLFLSSDTRKLKLR